MNKFNIFILLLSVVYIFYNFDFTKIDWSIFNIFGVCLTIFIVFLGQVFLSIRWQKLTKLSFKSAFETTIVSSFLNMVLPAKLGEVSKILYLKKFYNQAINKISASLFVERFFDIIMLGIIMLMFFYFYFQNEILENSIISLILFIFLCLIFFKLPIFKKLLKKIPIKFVRVYSQKLYNNINKILNSPFEIIFWSLMVWGSYFLANGVFYYYGVKFDLDFIQIFEIFLFSSIVLSISITPGGIATYEAAMVFVLSKYGIDKENAFMASFVYHFILYFVDFILFGIFLFVKDLKFKDLK